MLNKLHLAGYGLALAIIAYLLFNPRVEHVPIEYEEDPSLRDTTEVTKVVTDTVTVYDTTKVSLSIPEPEKEDSLNEYTTRYSDAFINARITSTIEGILHKQDFWYVRAVEHIESNTLTTLTISRYMKPTRVFSPEQQNSTQLWGGITAEDFGKDISFTPNLMLIRNNVAYEVGYNINKESTTKFKLEALRLGAKIKF